MQKYQREWIAKRKREFFAGKVCATPGCGSTKDLQLDHKDPDQKVSHKIWSWSDERRATELAKCQVLCKECHKKKTSIDRARHMTHGTEHYYRKYACRCPLCVKAASDARQRRRGKLVVPVGVAPTTSGS